MLYYRIKMTKTYDTEVDVLLINGQISPISRLPVDVRRKVTVRLTKEQIAKRTLLPVRVVDCEPSTVITAIDADIARSADHASQLRAERELDSE